MFENEIQFFRRQTGFSGPVRVELKNLGLTLGNTNGRTIQISKFVSSVQNTLFHELWHCLQIERGELNLKEGTFKGSKIVISRHAEQYEIEARKMAQSFEIAYFREKRENFGN